MSSEYDGKMLLNKKVFRQNASTRGETILDAQNIIDEMKVLSEIDPAFEIKRRIEFIQTHLKVEAHQTHLRLHLYTLKLD